MLLHPTKSPAVVEASNRVATGVHDFHERLGIESGRTASETRRWLHAATEARDKALEQGSKGMDAALTLSTETFNQASSLTGRFSSEISGRARRWLGDDAAKSIEAKRDEEGEAEVCGYP